MAQPEVNVLRFAYSVLLITLALMTWAYVARADSSSLLSYQSPQHRIGSPGFDKHPSCSFNQLCTCSNPGPDLGIVTCSNIPLGVIPSVLNNSRVHELYLTGNNLQILDDKRLVYSGLRRLEIKENKLHYVYEDAFAGLEKLLRELDLQSNELTNIPTALRNLRKLELLDLSDNKITDVKSSPSDFYGFESSLTSLSLANNLIYKIDEGTFAKLTSLERLDLSGNKIYEIKEASMPATRSFKMLDVSGNQLTRLPYEALARLSLAHLDLSDNIIEDTGDISSTWKLVVTFLDLSKNRLSELAPYTLLNFKSLDKLSLASNPLEAIAEDAFKNPKVQQLDLSNCIISYIHPAAFRGLESSLTVLDLSFNNLSHVDPAAFAKLTRLQELNIAENRVQMSIQDFSRFAGNLKSLNLIGNPVGKDEMEYFRKLPRLRSFSSSQLPASVLQPVLFNGSSSALEEIKIIRAKITTLAQHAFATVPGLKYLDLSYNSISNIDRTAFSDIGRTLYKLKIQSGLRMHSVPADVLRELTHLRQLDLSSNGLTKIADSSFNPALEYVNFRFNKISSIGAATFSAEQVPNVQRILLGQNNILEIPALTFNGLRKLEYLELNENKIYKLSARAFLRLDQLKALNIAGNKITQIADEAFQNLPRLQTLDLSHNHLTTINFEAFDTVGTLSLFQIRLSHNKLERLISPQEEKSLSTERAKSASSFSSSVASSSSSSTSSAAAAAAAMPSSAASLGESNLLQHHQQGIPGAGIPFNPTTTPNPTPAKMFLSSSTVEMIDLSYNNISYISPDYFFPIINTLIDINLSHNSLKNVSRSHLTGAAFLQRLHLDFNQLTALDTDLFTNTRALQILTLDQNQISDLPGKIFDSCSKLRYLSMENNNMANLDATLFLSSPIEFLNLAGNSLQNFPEPALAKVSSSLVSLNLSNNRISSVFDQIQCLQSVRDLNLSGNKIVFLLDTAFDNTKKILHIDISNNQLTRLTARIFENFRDHLITLNVSGIGLTSLPEFNFSRLTTLDASRNKLDTIPIGFGENIPQLRIADFSSNEFTNMPNFVRDVFPQINQIRLSSNKIQNLRNDSFYKLNRLHYLDISDLPLESIQLGVLQPLNSLETLRIGPLPEKRMLSFILQQSMALRHLIMEVDRDGIDLDKIPLPPKLSKITITGRNLTNIGNGSFDNFRSRNLELTIQDTGISSIPSKFFATLGLANLLKINIKGANKDLKSISNPSLQYRLTSMSPYLLDLDLDQGLRLSCSCENGWMEQWLANWMQMTCGADSGLADFLVCETMAEKMRSIKCRDNSKENLMHMFASADCGWENAAVSLSHFGFFPLVAAAILATTTITQLLV